MESDSKRAEACGDPEERDALGIDGNTDAAPANPSAIPLAYMPAPPPPEQRLAPRVLLFVAVASVTSLIAWCANDYYLVRHAPARLRNPNWIDWVIVLVYLLVVVTSAAITYRRLPARRRIFWALTCTVATLMLAFALIACVGVSFHMAIGGSL